MFRPRVIPVLLLKNKGLIKTTTFKDGRYIGDPINAVKLFNHLRVDELIFLDIEATRNNRVISLDLVKKIGEETEMPFAVGGGIRALEDVRAIISAGAEKIIVNTYAFENPDFISEVANEFGSSAIVVCIDVKRNFFGKEEVWVLNGCRRTKYLPVEYAKLMADKGAGEIIIQSIENDGKMCGYDIGLIKKISNAVTIPVIGLGGAGNKEHLKEAYLSGTASAVAAGSMFVFHGPKRGVLINYPEKSELNFNRE